MIWYAASRVFSKISRIASSSWLMPAAVAKSPIGMPAMLADDQTGTSESPCSPAMWAWTDRGSTP